MFPVSLKNAKVTGVAIYFHTPSPENVSCANPVLKEEPEENLVLL
jgi:hypothetical protein